MAENSEPVLPCLTFFLKNQEMLCHFLVDGFHTIGRNKTDSIFIKHADIKLQHCVIRVKKGSAFLFYRQENCDIQLNGELLSSYCWYKMCHNDVIMFGMHLYAVYKCECISKYESILKLLPIKFDKIPKFSKCAERENNQFDTADVAPLQHSYGTLPNVNMCIQPCTSASALKYNEEDDISPTEDLNLLPTVYCADKKRNHNDCTERKHFEKLKSRIENDDNEDDMAATQLCTPLPPSNIENRNEEMNNENPIYDEDDISPTEPLNFASPVSVFKERKMTNAFSKTKQFEITSKAISSNAYPSSDEDDDMAATQPCTFVPPSNSKNRNEEMSNVNPICDEDDILPTETLNFTSPVSMFKERKMTDAFDKTKRIEMTSRAISSNAYLSSDEDDDMLPTQPCHFKPFADIVNEMEGFKEFLEKQGARGSGEDFNKNFHTPRKIETNVYRSSSPIPKINVPSYEEDFLPTQPFFSRKSDHHTDNVSTNLSSDEDDISPTQPIIYASAINQNMLIDKLNTSASTSDISSENCDSDDDEIPLCVGLLNSTMSHDAYVKRLGLLKLMSNEHLITYKVCKPVKKKHTPSLYHIDPQPSTSAYSPSSIMNLQKLKCKSPKPFDSSPIQRPKLLDSTNVYGDSCDNFMIPETPNTGIRLSTSDNDLNSTRSEKGSFVICSDSDDNLLDETVPLFEGEEDSGPEHETTDFIICETQDEEYEMNNVHSAPKNLDILDEKQDSMYQIGLPNDKGETSKENFLSEDKTDFSSYSEDITIDKSINLDMEGIASTIDVINNEEDIADKENGSNYKKDIADHIINERTSFSEKENVKIDKDEIIFDEEIAFTNTDVADTNSGDTEIININSATLTYKERIINDNDAINIDHNNFAVDKKNLAIDNIVTIETSDITINHFATDPDLTVDTSNCTINKELTIHHPIINKNLTADKDLDTDVLTVEKDLATVVLVVEKDRTADKNLAVEKDLATDVLAVVKDCAVDKNITIDKSTNESKNLIFCEKSVNCSTDISTDIYIDKENSNINEKNVTVRKYTPIDKESILANDVKIDEDNAGGHNKEITVTSINEDSLDKKITCIAKLEKKPTTIDDSVQTRRKSNVLNMDSNAVFPQTFSSLRRSNRKNDVINDLEVNQNSIGNTVLGNTSSKTSNQSVAKIVKKQSKKLAQTVFKANDSKEIVQKRNNKSISIQEALASSTNKDFKKQSRKLTQKVPKTCVANDSKQTNIAICCSNVETTGVPLQIFPETRRSGRKTNAKDKFDLTSMSNMSESNSKNRSTKLSKNSLSLNNKNAVGNILSQNLKHDPVATTSKDKIETNVNKFPVATRRSRRILKEDPVKNVVDSNKKSECVIIQNNPPTNNTKIVDLNPYSEVPAKTRSKQHIAVNLVEINQLPLDSERQNISTKRQKKGASKNNSKILPSDTINPEGIYPLEPSRNTRSRKQNDTSNTSRSRFSSRNLKIHSAALGSIETTKNSASVAYPESTVQHVKVSKRRQSDCDSRKDLKIMKISDEFQNIKATCSKNEILISEPASRKTLNLRISLRSKTNEKKKTNLHAESNNERGKVDQITMIQENKGKWPMSNSKSDSAVLNQIETTEILVLNDQVENKNQIVKTSKRLQTDCSSRREMKIMKINEEKKSQFQNNEAKSNDSGKSNLLVENKNNKSKILQITPKNQIASIIGNRKKSEDEKSNSSVKSYEKPHIMFTGIEINDSNEKIVIDLGGVIVEDANICTHLVTDKVRRTVKFLCCIAKGIPIVTEAWLKKSSKQKRFVAHSPFTLHDKNSESTYNFSLPVTLQKAKSAPLLQGWIIHVTKNVTPGQNILHSIIEAAGGSYWNIMPSCRRQKNLIVISCEKDKKDCHHLSSYGVPVVDVEFLFTGLLQYDLNFTKYNLII